MALTNNMYTNIQFKNNIIIYNINKTIRNERDEDGYPNMIRSGPIQTAKSMLKAYCERRLMGVDKAMSCLENQWEIVKYPV